MKFDFSKIELKDIHGKVIKKANVHKTVGNLIYNTTRDLGLLETAQAVYKGGKVELDKTEVVEIERIIDDPNSAVLAFARKAIHEYIDKTKKSKTEPIRTD